MSHDKNLSLCREAEGGSNLVPVIPCVKGILYADEEVPACPLCEDRLMWYHLPQDMEMLACTNHLCVYPFDEVSPYEIRSRNHNKVCIEGTPAARGDPSLDEILNHSGTPKLNAPNTSTASAEMSMELEPYKPSNYDRAAVEQHLQEFMQIPEKLREPTVETFPFIDIGALDAVITGLKTIEQDEAASSLD